MKPTEEHGLYLYHKIDCRCEVCKAAMKEHSRKQRIKKLEKIKAIAKANEESE